MFQSPTIHPRGEDRRLINKMNPVGLGIARYFYSFRAKASCQGEYASELISRCLLVSIDLAGVIHRIERLLLLQHACKSKIGGSAYVTDTTIAKVAAILHVRGIYPATWVPLPPLQYHSISNS